MEVDYCTKSPDTLNGIYIGDICRVHDKAYRKGGNKQDRKNADINLRNGVIDRTGFVMGWIYYIGVRLFGGKNFKWK